MQRLTEQQLPAATAMIGRAFHNDPLSIYVYADEVTRARLLPLVYGIVVPLYQKFGFTIASEGNIPGSQVGVWAMVRVARLALR